MIKTFNQINKDIRNLVLYFLEFFDIQDFQVLQLNQPTKTTEKDNCLFFQIVNVNHFGWQKTNYQQDKKEQKYIETIQVKFSCLKKRKTTDNIEKKESQDIISIFKSFLISDDGLKYLNDNGYNILMPKQIDLTDFVDEYDNFELLPTMTVIFLTKQSWDVKVEIIEEIKEKIIEKI